MEYIKQQGQYVQQKQVKQFCVFMAQFLKPSQEKYYGVHFCCHNHCQVHIHNSSLRNVERELSKSHSNSTSSFQFQLYSKYIDKVYGMLSKDYRCQIPLCVKELIRSLSLGKKGQYSGFRYADGTKIDQLEECQLKDKEEVFHMQIIISAIDVENFVAWETQDSNEKQQLKKLDICFDDLNLFLEMMICCYEIFQQ